MAKRPATKKIEPSWLQTAMDHVCVVGDGPSHYAPFCHFMPGWAVGYDGIVGAGIRVYEDMRVAPQAKTLRDAAKRAGSPYSLTLTSAGDALTINGNGVRVRCETLGLEHMPNVQPDRPQKPLTVATRKLFGDVAKITTSQADKVFLSSLLLKDKTCAATNGTTILQGWHGNEIAGEYLLPREFAEALSACKWEPSAYGISDATFTAWFGENAWLRANVYAEQFPDVEVMMARIMSGASDFRPVPPALAQGVQLLKAFLNERGTLTLHPYGLNTALDHSGASFSFEHFIHAPVTLDYPAWLALAQHASEVAVSAEGVIWRGDRLRGASILVP